MLLGDAFNLSPIEGLLEFGFLLALHPSKRVDVDETDPMNRFRVIEGTPSPCAQGCVFQASLPLH